MLGLCGLINGIIKSVAPNSSYAEFLQALDVTSTPDAISTPSPTPVPTFQDLLTETLQGVNYYELKKVDYDPASKSVSVTYYWDAFMDNQAVINDTQLMCFNTERALWQSNLTTKFDSVKAVMQGDLIDKYGNKSVGVLGDCELYKTTAQKFNWDNLSQDSAWNVYDLTWLLPSLEKNQ